MSWFRTRQLFKRCYRHFTTLRGSQSGVLTPKKSLQLHSGVILPSEAIRIHYAFWGDKQKSFDSKPLLLICPSMSNSCFMTNHPSLEDKPDTPLHGGKWWTLIAGYGDNFGINLDKYNAISFTPLGSPFGTTTSPLTINPKDNKPYGSNFPTITPKDQAKFIRMGLEELNIHNNIYGIIGGSMGGMQALEYACQYPKDYTKLCAIATTGFTSPSTVALRSIQRKIVRLDPIYRKLHDKNYKEITEEDIHKLGNIYVYIHICTYFKCCLVCRYNRRFINNKNDWNDMLSIKTRI